MRTHSDSDFGIYILSYPGDFHLALSLIGSIRYFHPDMPIMVIPGEGYIEGQHPFDVPVMRKPSGYWGELGFIDRKFWAYQGPFEKFLYIDADIICTHSIDRLLQRIHAQQGKFLFANIYYEGDAWTTPVSDPSHLLHQHHLAWVPRALGSLEHMRAFDTSYDPLARCPFNAGIFASSRETFSEADFRDVIEREAAYYRAKLGKDFSWRTEDVFYRDQGRLNYLVDSLGIPLLNLHPDGHDIWGGHARHIKVEDVLANNTEFSFIHWAGVPRPSPSLFCSRPLYWFFKRGLGQTYVEDGYKDLPEIPGYSVWRHFQPRQSESMSLRSRMQYSYKDLKRIVRLQLSEFGLLSA